MSTTDLRSFFASFNEDGLPDLPEPTPEERVEREAAERKKEAEERHRRRLRAMRSLGWERRALDLANGPNFDEERVAPYLTALRAIDETEEAGGIVVLAGNPGSGKTAAAARWGLFGGCAPRFLRAAEYFRWSRYDHEKRDELFRASTLVLDDVGAEYADPNGSYRVDLDELVDRFYADKRTLVMTTNIAYATPDQRARLKASGVAVKDDAPTFVDRYGERVTDRIRECGKWVDSSTASMRRKA